MTAKADRQPNRKARREHLTADYLSKREVEKLREIDESIASRSLGRSYNRHLLGSFGYIVDCTPEVPKSSLVRKRGFTYSGDFSHFGLSERARRSGRCRTIVKGKPIR